MPDTITTDAEMLARVEAFLAKHGMAPTTFGRLAVGDGNLVPNLRGGRSLTLKLAGRLAAFMATASPATPQEQEAA